MSTCRVTCKPGTLVVVTTAVQEAALLKHKEHLVIDVTEMHHTEERYYCFNCGEHLIGGKLSWLP